MSFRSLRKRQYESCSKLPYKIPSAGPHCPGVLLKHVEVPGLELTFWSPPHAAAVMITGRLSPFHCTKIMLSTLEILSIVGQMDTSRDNAGVSHGQGCALYRWAGMGFLLLQEKFCFPAVGLQTKERELNEDVPATEPLRCFACSVASSDKLRAWILWEFLKPSL